VNTPNIVLYALNSLGPGNIAQELDYMREDGFTTIVIGMFHIGNPCVKKTTQLADIIFNGDEPLVIRDGKYVANAPDWPGQIARLKAQPGTTVTKVYASFGGSGDVVHDFATIKQIYDNNGQSFDGTLLKKNCEAFRATFPGIDGIDMDCEETYDRPSFVAFCKMLIGMGFDITFCPWEKKDFWTAARAEIEEAHPGAVKWWNLQCYDGGGGNNPQDWAPESAPPGYIIAGDWVRAWNPSTGRWFGHCPPDMEQQFAMFSKQPCLGGGFIWSLDLIRDTEKNVGTRPLGNGCGSQTLNTARVYKYFMQRGLGL
jgi:hypothetical protein